MLLQGLKIKGGEFVGLENRAENGKKVARKKYVKTGITYNGLTEILHGLEEGDKIINAGYKDLYEGQIIDYK